MHLELERRLAEFLGTEQAIVFSSAYATMSSVIPTFASRGDLIIAYGLALLAPYPYCTHGRLSCAQGRASKPRDQDGSPALPQRGVLLQAQRHASLASSLAARVKSYALPDMDDLRRILESVREEDRRTGRRLTRRFIIVEGLYRNTGQIVPLPELLRLKASINSASSLSSPPPPRTAPRSNTATASCWTIAARSVCSERPAAAPASITAYRSTRWKWCVEGSRSTERRLREAQVAGDLGNALASVGGFCAGSDAIVSHLRLNASGYVFSASSPPFLMRAATVLHSSYLFLVSFLLADRAARQVALDLLQQNPELVRRLEKNARVMREALKPLSSLLEIGGDPLSPLIHLRLRVPSARRVDDEVYPLARSTTHPHA